MDNWKDYIWALPIVGAIIAFISIAIPAAVSSYLKADGFSAPFSIDIWMIGFFDAGIGGEGWVDEINKISGGVGFDMTTAIYILSFIGVLLGGILGLGAGGLGARGDFRKSFSLASGALMIIFTIIFIIGVEVDASIYSGDSFDMGGTLVEYKFNVGFGVIGPFIGGVICIASFFMDRIPTTERIVPETPKQPQVTAKPQVMAQPQAQPSSGAKFCTHCGTEVPGDFCPGCGKPFQP